MFKLILIPLIVFGLIFTEGIFQEEIYELVGGKGRINVLENYTSSVNETAKEDGNEMANLPGQEIYRSVDEKGTINFSDNPTSSVITRKEGAPKQDGAEVLQRNEMGNRAREEIYRSADGKGTANFSDSPTSPVVTNKSMSAKQEREEILKRNETANRRPMTDFEMKAVLLTMPSWQGSATSPGWWSSGTGKRGKS